MSLPRLGVAPMRDGSGILSPSFLSENEMAGLFIELPKGHSKEFEGKVIADCLYGGILYKVIEYDRGGSFRFVVYGPLVNREGQIQTCSVIELVGSDWKVPDRLPEVPRLTSDSGRRRGTLGVGWLGDRWVPTLLDSEGKHIFPLTFKEAYNQTVRGVAFAGGSVSIRHGTSQSDGRYTVTVKGQLCRSLQRNELFEIAVAKSGDYINWDLNIFTPRKTGQA